jgi:hypothetical protein
MRRVRRSWPRPWTREAWIRFLHHVGRIHAGAETPVESEQDELAEIRLVPSKQPFQRVPVAVVGPLEKRAGLCGVGCQLNHSLP